MVLQAPDVRRGFPKTHDSSEGFTQEAPENAASSPSGLASVGVRRLASPRQIGL